MVFILSINIYMSVGLSMKLLIELCILISLSVYLFNYYSFTFS